MDEVKLPQKVCPECGHNISIGEDGREYCYYCEDKWQDEHDEGR